MKKNKKALFLPILLCLVIMSSITAFAYSGSGDTVSFTLSDGAKKYTNRDKSSSWSAPNKDTITFRCDKTNNASGKAKTIQCVQQNTALDTVLYEKKNVSGTIGDTKVYPTNKNNRLFAYGEWSEGTYSGTVKISW